MCLGFVLVYVFCFVWVCFVCVLLGALVVICLGVDFSLVGIVDC